MDSNSLGALAGASKWYALAAFLVALFIRLLKDDTKLPTIPARLRPWLAALAGVVALAVDKLARGASWKDALFNAAIVGLGPIVVHELGVEAIFGGKDLPLPNVGADRASQGREGSVDPSDGAPRPRREARGLPRVRRLHGLLPSASSSRTASEVTRDVAAASVLLFVQSVELGDTICANIAIDAKNAPIDQEKKARDLAKMCAKGKDLALLGARAASSALKAWGAASAGKLACAAGEVLDGLNMIRDALVRAGGVIPDAIDDGIARASALAKIVTAGACEVSS
jgi:hypothetical protein